MRNSLRFLHTADLHLDSPFKGMSNVPNTIFQQMIESTFRALNRLVEKAIEEQVDFVLIVGDLFDESARSLKAQIKLRQALDKLNQHNIDVFISFGNHDHLGGNFFQIEYPENVHIFQEENVSYIPFYKNGQHVANIYGFSYEERAVTAEKVKEFQVTNDSIFHVAMLHGSLATNREHDVYAPFRLADFDRSGMDYWALGHIHKREQLLDNPPVVYSGNIQGRNIKESGEKGCYLVELVEGDYSLTFIPTQEIRFEEIKVNASNCESLDQLEQFLISQKEEWRRQFGKAIVRLRMETDNSIIGSLSDDLIVELLDILNEMEEDITTWVLLESIKLNAIVTWDRETIKKGKHFTAELLRVIENTDNLHDVMREITEHREVRKVLDPFSSEELKEIKEDAEKLLLEELLKE